MAYPAYRSLGDLPQHPLRPAGAFDHRAVLQKREGARRPGVPLDVAHHRAELRLLYPGGAVGGRRPADRDADDPQDLRLCLDGADRIFRHEKRVRLTEPGSSAGGRGLCEAF